MRWKDGRDTIYEWDYENGRLERLIGEVANIWGTSIHRPARRWAPLGRAKN
jgi:hypothetical protein